MEIKGLYVSLLRELAEDLPDYVELHSEQYKALRFPVLLAMIGVTMNLVAMYLNGGRMPVDFELSLLHDMHYVNDRWHIVKATIIRGRWLSDIIYTPIFIYGKPSIISIGDIVIIIGIILLTYKSMKLLVVTMLYEDKVEEQDFRLECSEAGDERFAPTKAEVTMFGRKDTIDNHYLKCKPLRHLNVFNWTEIGKEAPKEIYVNKVTISGKYLEQYHKLLWLTYLDNNADLVEYAKGMLLFTNKYKGRYRIYNGCDVVKQYVTLGRESILEDCEELIKILE